MGVLYHIRPYFAGIFPYIGLIYGRYLQFRFLKWPLMCVCMFSYFLLFCTSQTSYFWTNTQKTVDSSRRPQQQGRKCRFSFLHLFLGNFHLLSILGVISVISIVVTLTKKTGFTILFNKKPAKLSQFFWVVFQKCCVSPIWNTLFLRNARTMSPCFCWMIPYGRKRVDWGKAMAFQVWFVGLSSPLTIDLENDTIDYHRPSLNRLYNNWLSLSIIVHAIIRFLSG